MNQLSTQDETKDLERRLKTYRLNRDEYDQICKILGRAPKGVEWALFSALWSEHCSYKSSKVHLKKLFRQSERVLEAEGENAGVIDLGQGERIAFKMESHNHPSFIEPYQGAATGVGGILRDIFTMGARPIALADYLCFGEPEASRMTALVDGVVRGIGGYGNCVGVPTVTGQTEFHSSYNGNILVNAMAVGLFRPGEQVYLSRAQGAGNYVVYVGAKTGRDGVHGASMASESFAEDSAQKRPTVQIGDPFFEKLLIESCLEVMRENLVVAIQDMGAAGLTSSSFEMAAKGGVGLTLHLDRVPLRDSTLTPEEILLSESQERMLLICEPHQFKRLQEIFHRWDLEATVLGEVTREKTVQLFWKDEIICEMDPNDLVERAPVYNRPFTEWKFPRQLASGLKSTRDLNNIANELKRILSSPEGTAKDWIYRQYDQRVGTLTVRDCEAPLAVLRLPDSGRGLGVVVGCRPYLMRIDAMIGGADAVAYPALVLASQGFEAVGVTDCLNFGNPERENVMSEFVASLNGMNQACAALNAPIVSGNVSFYNETLGVNITSTPATGLIGLRDNTEQVPHSYFTKSGEAIYQIKLPMIEIEGRYWEQKTSQAGSFSGQWQSPTVAQFVRAVQKLSRLCTSSRVVGAFGLGYTLARMTMVAGIGTKIDKWNSQRGLLDESLYEVILTVPQEWIEKFEQTAQQNLSSDVVVQRLGLTGGSDLEIGNQLKVPIRELREAYRTGWGKAFEELA